MREEKPVLPTINFTQKAQSRQDIFFQKRSGTRLARLFIWLIYSHMKTLAFRDKKVYVSIYMWGATVPYTKC